MKGIKLTMGPRNCRQLYPGLRRTPVAVLLMLAYLQGSGHVSTGQKLPTRDEEHLQYTNRYSESFYDTSLLPDGQEMTLYLRSQKRFYFLVEERSPLLIVMMPCTTETIHWRLMYQTFNVQLSGDGIEDEELLTQAKFPRGAPPSPDQRFILREGNISRTVTTFRIGDTLAGLYTLLLTPQKGPVSIKVFGSTSLADRPFPELPTDNEVKLTHTVDSEVTLSWKPSPSEQLHNLPVEYCISVNHREHLNSQCTASTYKYGDRSPELPPHVGFGFPGERERFKQITIKPKSRYGIFYTCIGTKTSFTYHIHKDSSRRKYVFDVFAVNTRTNSSATYVGVSTRSKAKSRVPQTMSEGEVRGFNLSTSHPVRYSTFALRKRTTDLYIYILPCEHRVELELYRKRHLVNKTTILPSGGMLVLHDVKKGVYRIRVKSRKESTRVQAVYSTSLLTLPFAPLPASTSLDVDNSTGDCTSLTVSWDLAPGDNRYCLYARRTHGTSDHNRQPHRSCTGRPRRKRRHKVSCSRRDTRDGHERLYQTVENLTSGAHYQLDVYVGGNEKRWSSYSTRHTQVNC